LGDYASIKNGSYKKLLNAYYKKQEAAGSVTLDATKKELLATKQAAESLKSAARTITQTGATSVFEKVKKSVTDEKTGVTTEVEDYDRDKILSAVKNFVKSYNSTVDATADQDNLPILRKGSIMVSGTSSNSGLLKKVGISIGEGNQLSVDETKLKKADINDLKTLFEGKNSYADRMLSKATEISLVASNAMSSNRLYGVNGKYSISDSLGNLFNQIG
jgi:flagellar capping protein FliD